MNQSQFNEILSFYRSIHGKLPTTYGRGQAEVKASANDQLSDLCKIMSTHMVLDFNLADEVSEITTAKALCDIQPMGPTSSPIRLVLHSWRLVQGIKDVPCLTTPAAVKDKLLIDGYVAKMKLALSHLQPLSIPKQAVDL